jgi:hypothetical protein
MQIKRPFVLITKGLFVLFYPPVYIPPSGV